MPEPSEARRRPPARAAAAVAACRGARSSGARAGGAQARSGAPARVRAGRAGVGLLLLIGALIALTAGAWLFLERGDAPSQGAQRHPPGSAPGAIAPDALEPGRGAEGEAPDLPAFRDTGEPTEVAARPPAAEDFRGRGSIRGTVVLPPGLELPETWAVAVGPSRSLSGRERAESRRVELPGSTREFELANLPLGGYDVRIEGDGLGGHPVPVLLVRGSEHAFVNVAVHRRGLLDGFLLDELGAPVEDVLVVLEDLVSGERHTTRTLPSGGYALTSLPDSEYRIHFGGTSHPLIPAEELSFRAPSMRYPVRRIPAMGTLLVHTIDPHGSPIGNATLQGYSPSGGVIEARTDDFGMARVPNLRPGRYTLAARTDEPPREGRVSVEIEAGYEDTVRIALVPSD